MKNKQLKLRAIDISHKHSLAHLGSVLTAIDVINEIYENKKPNDKFILSAGHAGLALYVVLEAFGFGDAEQMLIAGGIHPEKSVQPVDCSTGSLGHGLGIGIGMALANPDAIVHVYTTDGELAEGSMWEALEVIRRRGVLNVRLHVTVNGFSAYDFVDREFLRKRLEMYDHVADLDNDVTGMTFVDHEFIKINDIKASEEFPFLTGMDAHYHVLNDNDIEFINSVYRIL